MTLRFLAAPSASPQIILILAQLSMAAINLFECGKIPYYYINHPVVIENMQLRLYDKTINNLHDPSTEENVHFIIVIQKYVLYSGVKASVTRHFITAATRVLRRIHTNCGPAVRSRTCRSGCTLKFPHIKFNDKKKGSPDGPFPTHNKQAGKGIFTSPTKWNMRNPVKDFTSYYCCVKSQFVEVNCNNDLSQHLERIKLCFLFYSLTNMVPWDKNNHCVLIGLFEVLATPWLQLIVLYMVCFLGASAAFSVLIT